jgi:flagellar hook-associated protein FlgK
MDEFWSAWLSLSNNPGGTAERTALLERTRVLAQKFNSLSSDLDQFSRSTNAYIDPLLFQRDYEIQITPEDQ